MFPGSIEFFSNHNLLLVIKRFLWPEGIYSSLSVLSTYICEFIQGFSHVDNVVFMLSLPCKMTVNYPEGC